ALHEAAVELALARLAGRTDAHRAGGRAERQLELLGVRVSPSGPAGILRQIAAVRDVPLAIETLGGFRVFRSGSLVPATTWQSQKARDLLKILLARRGAATPRDVLMEALWPGEERSRLANRLSVALSTARSVLEPERTGEESQVLWADKRAVGLDLESVVVDVEEFLAEGTEGLELRAAGSAGALERLEHAVALYRGDFLEGDAYEDWAAPLREEARALYAEVTHALAEDASAGDQHELAARYYLRILGRDAHDEAAHLGLVASLAGAGRHGEARRRYGVYCRRMEEIGVEAAPFPARPPAAP
ncbi:MAG: AfsR/SARP family transcriptional regulator, partial [Gaiellaceae bacterium]